MLGSATRKHDEGCDDEGVSLPYSQGNDFTPIVDSQSNATAVLETKHAGLLLRHLERRLGLQWPDQWIGWVFNELLLHPLASAIASKHEVHPAKRC